MLYYNRNCFIHQVDLNGNMKFAGAGEKQLQMRFLCTSKITANSTLVKEFTVKIDMKSLVQLYGHSFPCTQETKPLRFL